MVTVSRQSAQRGGGRRPAYSYAVTAAAVTGSALVGARAVDTGTGWYRGLDKPAWQPPSWAFGAVWTPLYASIAWAGGHALNRTRGAERRALAASLAVNLTLNAGWTWAFFGRRNPRAGLAGALALDLSNVQLLCTTARSDGAAAAALVPYAAWCSFATALSAAIVRRNR